MECSSIGHLPRRNELDPTGGRHFSLTRSGCSSKVQLLRTLTNISWPRGMSIWSVLLFMALLLTQPSDQRSLPEFKTNNLQTAELQTANLHIEVQNLQRTESLNFSTQSLEFTVNRKIISQAFVQKSLSVLQRKLLLLVKMFIEVL